ncbi:hypothetical protein OSTOST_24855 [Ostertagia ostertagi]
MPSQSQCAHFMGQSLPQTSADFWRMILFEHVSHIIMLCDTIEQGKMKCEQYWPNEQDEKMEIGGTDH